MLFQGDLHKMRVAPGETDAEAVHYTLASGEQALPINTLLGQEITLRFTGVIHCTRCGRTTSKAFGEGYCYPCFTTAPENAPCIVRPELCEAHLGKGRDPEWEDAHHNQPHVVYLAFTSGLKVGVTRVANIPTRWIDQGAVRVIRLAEVPYRQLAGEIEVALKEFLDDKTAWQKMLRDIPASELPDLVAEKDRAARLLPEPLQDYLSDDDTVHTFAYPVFQYPPKLTSVSFDKTPEISGTLTGIKGQYLLFEDGKALNIRRHEGYEVRME